MTRNRKLFLPLIAAAALFWARPALADGVLGAPLIKSGDIAAVFIGADADYSNDVYYFATVGEMASATFLFNNHAGPPGTIVDPDDSALAIGAEAIFGICVDRGGVSPGTACAEADDFFYTGAASRNDDNLAHALVWSRADYEAQFGALDPTVFPPEYSYVVGFEDILGGGDEDYNDAIFAVRGVNVSVVPEPLTMTLLASGLVGVGGASLRRRRKQD